MTARAQTLALLAIALLCSGCITTQGGGLFGWWTRRGERAVERAEQRVESARADVLRAAQQRVQEAVVALLTAPPSRPVDVASEASTQAAALLAEANGPLTVEQLAQVRTQVAALLSDNEALRAEGERLRAAAREADASASAELTSLRAELAAARARADTVAADNATLSARYLRMRWGAIAGAVGTLALGVAAWATRSNYLGLATATAGGLVDLERKQGPAVADLARGALDALLNRGEAGTIFRALSKIAPDIARRVGETP